MAKKVSLRQLAQEVGLHSSTVSRALSGHPAINEKTVQRVEAAAKRLGYVPNPDVRMAMSSIRRATEDSLHGIIAVLNFHPLEPKTQAEIRNGRLYRGIQRRAESLGWKADEIEMRAPGMSVRRLHSILKARNISGAILLPHPLNEPVPEMDLNPLRLVATSATWNTVGCFQKTPAVLPAHWRNAQLIFEHIQKMGYRRPLLVIHSGIEDRHMHATEAAFLLSQSQGAWDTNIPVVTGKLDPKIVGALVKSEKPDVIVGPDTFVKNFFEKELNLRVPEDCGFLAYARISPEISGFDQEWDMIGESAVDLLTGMLMQRAAQSQDTHRVLLVQGNIQQGPTLPKKRRKAKRNTSEGA